MSDLTPPLNAGVVLAVRGSVVDIRFERHAPPVHNLLRAGASEAIAIEVLSQTDPFCVRGIALTATQSLARGMVVRDTGGPLMAPVGESILSRMFDVFGNTIDRLSPPADVQRRSVHRPPPQLADRSIKSEVFATGIKVFDVLVPLERMREAEQALRTSVLQLPANLSERFEGGTALAAADRRHRRTVRHGARAVPGSRCTTGYRTAEAHHGHRPENR